MTLNTVTLTWNIADLIDTGLQARITLTPTAVLTDSTDHLVIPEVPRSVLFVNGTGSLPGIIACDNTQITPAGWAYTIQIVSSSGQTIVGPFTAFINYASGATQDLSTLVPVQNATTFQAYLPLPSGTPSSGQVPIATGTGEASAWGTPGSGAFVPLSYLPLAVPNGGTGQTTQQAALDALAGSQAAGKYLRSDGTHTTLTAILAGDVPTLNQNTTGNAGTATNLAGGATAPAYLAPQVVNLTFGSSIPVNAALGNDYRLTLTASTGTLANPTSPVDGQRIIVQVTQGGGGSFTLAYGTAYEFSTALPAPTLSTAAGTTDLLGFVYNTAKGKWLFVAFVNGFA